MPFATLTTICAAWTLVGVATSLALLRINAHYARFFTGKTYALPSVVHGLWMWTLGELVSPVSFALSCAYFGGSFVSLLPTLYMVHYTYRSFIYPLLRTRTLKPVPLEIVLMTVMFNSVNGALNGAGVALLPQAPVHLQAIGGAMFALGLFGNIHSDEVTRALRKNAADRNTYRIPPAVGLHALVASPNYASELFEWIGYAVAANFSAPALSFVAWTAANLVPRAISNRRWYVEKFGTKYPKQRRILIPYIW
eukprot:m51a1_g7640 hypothetical protein (252) ;mRNA; r:361512-362714